MTQSDDLSFAPNANKAHRFFEAQADYAASPLHQVITPDGLTMLAKDETQRMGLGAFKALGAPYALMRILDEMWQQKTGGPLPDDLNNPEFRAFAADQTFVCASAGNHGLGVAAGARKMGAKARVHLSDTVPETFARRLAGFGAQVVRSGAVYDDSITAATEDAERRGAVLLADGTWPGYTQIPKWVMEGYCVIAEELRAEFEKTGIWPTHVFLQAGVGGLAAAMAHMIRFNWSRQPEIVVVEPGAAACLQASHKAGKPTRGDGPDSAMGRLDCKEPSIVALQVLERCNVNYETLTEAEGLNAAEELSRLVTATTPSGAAGFGGLQKGLRAGLYGGEVRPLVIISENGG